MKEQETDQETEILIEDTNSSQVNHDENKIVVVTSSRLKTTNQFDIYDLLSEPRKQLNKRKIKHIVFICLPILVFEATSLTILRNVNIGNNSWKYVLSNILETNSESLGESSLTYLNLFLTGTFTVHVIWLIFSFIYYVFCAKTDNNNNNTNNNTNMQSQRNM